MPATIEEALATAGKPSLREASIIATELWLLDAFDPTPVESYVADEFSERVD